MGNSGCLLCWPREVQSSIRVAKESWGLLWSHCWANRPHLGLCPEANVPLHGRQGSRGCISFSPGVRPRLEWKQRTPLSSRVVTGMSWSPLSVLKGVKPPVAFGERTWDCSLGHAGNEGPHLGVTGESRGFTRAVAPVWGFLRSMTASSGSLSCGRQRSRLSMGGARRRASLLSSHGRGIGPQAALKKDSRGLYRVGAGNPVFPRLVPVT